MTMRRATLAVALLIALPLPASAARSHDPTAADPRVRFVAGLGEGLDGVGRMLGSARSDPRTGDAAADLVAEALRADRSVRAAIRDRAAAIAAVQTLLRAPRIDPTDPPAIDHEAVDIAAIRAAAARLAGAVAGVLAAPPPAAGPFHEGCDVVDEYPVLCIGGVGDNMYPRGLNYLVSIDLGGDDRYENAIGGAGCLDHEDPGESYCVNVGIDLGGDDTYETSDQIHACEGGGVGPVFPVCAHGTGILGIGMLVDRGGRDTYIANTVTRSDDCDGNFSVCGVLRAQGAGLFGVGVLADLGGDDLYALRAAIPGPGEIDRSLSVGGQGAGVFGTGILWDDAGNDVYEVTGPATGYTLPNRFWEIDGFSSYVVQGYAIDGAGVLYDASGDDRFSLRISYDDSAASRTARGPWGEGSSVLIDGQGFGVSVGGAPTTGIIATGKGATTYELSSSVRLRQSVRVQGWGPGGAIVDDGGDDRYLADLDTAAVFSSSCAGDCAVELDWTADGFVGFHVDNTMADLQAGALQGLIRDAAGNDTYRATASGRLSVATSAGGHAVALTRNVGLISLRAQGSGASTLFDADGDDTYEIATSHHIDAVANGASAEATVIAGYSEIWGQGTSGHLIDAGGADRYATRSIQRATATPMREDAIDDGGLSVRVQGIGSESGGLVDVDAGQPDTFLAESPGIFDVCDGAHGVSPGWTAGRPRTLMTTQTSSCRRSGGGAVVSSAGTSRAPTHVSVSTAPASSGRLGFTAVATAADGSPLAGARVRVEYHGLLGTPYYEVGPWAEWLPMLPVVEAVTGPDGSVTGSLPAPHCEFCEDVRLVATYFGDLERAPSRALLAVASGGGGGTVRPQGAPRALLP